MDNRTVNKHCEGEVMNRLPVAAGKVGDNDTSATILVDRLQKCERCLIGFENV